MALRTLTVLLLMILTFTSCAFLKTNVQIGRANADLKTFCFDCDDNSTMVVNYKDVGYAWVFFPDKTMKLPQRMSGSGARYADAKYEFWNKGEDASFYIPDKSDKKQKVLTCKLNMQKSIWEDAKLKGVDFRATGNEPAWTLEINKDFMVFNYDYGAQRVQFKTPEPVSDQQKRRSIYTSYSWDRPVKIYLYGEKCTDTMDGAEYEAKVRIEYNGQTYHGCGKALH